jgi:hypothetical protein
MAAIHAGVVIDSDGGSVLVHMSKGLESVISASLNGVKSLSTGTLNATIYIKEGPSPMSFSCGTTAIAKLKFASGAKYGIECPENC